MLDATFESDGVVYCGGLDAAVKRCVQGGGRRGFGNGGWVGGMDGTSTIGFLAQSEVMANKAIGLLLPAPPNRRMLLPCNPHSPPAPPPTCFLPLPPLPGPPSRPCSYDFFSGQEAMLGAHDAPVKCVEWLPSRGLVVTGSWDRCVVGGGTGVGGAAGQLLDSCCDPWPSSSRLPTHHTQACTHWRH